nr:DUF998 domain-containing protein [Candidatus Njordarchaeum guaymaensis]
MSSILKRLLDPKVAGICGILGQSFVFLCIFLAITVSPWFSWTNYALSNLGDLTKPASAPIFNIGLIIGGIITVIFVLGLSMKTRTNALGLVATILLFASGIGMIGVGIFPMNYLLPHAVSAFLIFIPLTVSLLLFGFAQVRSKPLRIFGVVSLVLGLVCVVNLFIPWGPAIAIMEMVIVVPGYIWSLIASERLITSKDIVPGKQRKVR